MITQDIYLYKTETYFLSNDKISVQRVVEKSNFDMQMHSHNFIELCYVESGIGVHCINGENYGVQKGDLFLINENEVHGFYRLTQELHTINVMIQLNENVNIDLYKKVQVKLCGELVKKHTNKIEIGSTDQIDFYMKSMLQEYIGKKPNFQEMLTCLLFQLIIVILRQNDECENSYGTSQYTQELLKNKKITNDVINYVNKHYEKKILLSEIAKELFISKGYLCKIFKEDMGISIGDYIQQYRIWKSCEILSDTEMPINEIIILIGFSDYKQFIAAFKKHMKVTPSSYRKQFVKKFS